VELLFGEKNGLNISKYGIAKAFENGNYEQLLDERHLKLRLQ
jgi:hypothetical protein